MHRTSMEVHTIVSYRENAGQYEVSTYTVLQRELRVSPQRQTS